MSGTQLYESLIISNNSKFNLKIDISEHFFKITVFLEIFCVPDFLSTLYNLTKITSRMSLANQIDILWNKKTASINTLIKKNKNNLYLFICNMWYINWTIMINILFHVYLLLIYTSKAKLPSQNIYSMYHI